MINTRFKFKSEVPKVVDRHEKRNVRVLFKQGRYLQRTIQRMQRYRNRPSKPGEPPSAHRDSPAGALLRKLTSFFVDKDAQSVVAGPEVWAGSKANSQKPLPELLDAGGVVRLETDGQSVRANIEPRPFTAPVFSDGGENFRNLIEKEPL